MNFLILGVIIQSLVTIFILSSIWNKENKVNNLLLGYIIIVCLDFVYEYFLISRFADESILYTIPGSLRLFKGLIFLKITCEFVKINIDRTLRYFAILFSIIVLHNIATMTIEMFSLKGLSGIVRIYQNYMNYYPYMWIAILALNIYLLQKNKSTQTYISKIYKFFLLFVFSNVFIYFSLYKIGYTLANFSRIYTLTFFIQFAWITFIYIKIYKQNIKAYPVEKHEIKEKYSTQIKEDSELQAIAQRIQTYYKLNNSYLDENFSLEKLSKELNTPKASLSMTFSQFMNTNFHAYTNQNRIEYSIEKINKNPSINISDLAFESGFKSKATFYKYFKLKFNCTPNEYIYLNCKKELT